MVGLTLQFATQNCLGYYSKLNLFSKFHAEVATLRPHLKLRTLLYLEYYTIMSSISRIVAWGVKYGKR